MKVPVSAQRIRARINREGRRPVDDGLLGSYRTRFLLSLAMAVGLAVAAARLPVHPPPEAVHWYLAGESEIIPVQPLHRTVEEPGRDVYSPMMAELLFDNRILPAAARNEEAEQEVEEEEPAEEPQPEPTRLERLNHRQILHYAEEMPDIVGGMRSLFLRINYPEAARERGIEGLVVLGFVVDEEGFVHDMKVLESVHPLLDSAAVRAVRQTRFTPGRQGNQAVKVAMRLPVRFQLVTTSQSVADRRNGDDT